MAQESNPPSGNRPGGLTTTSNPRVRSSSAPGAATPRRSIASSPRLRPPLAAVGERPVAAWARDLVDTDDLVQDSVLQTLKKVGDVRASTSRRPAGLPPTGGTQPAARRVAAEASSTAVTDIEAVGLEAEGSPLEAAIGREEAVLYETALGRLRPEEREAIIARIEMGYDWTPQPPRRWGKPSPDAARKAVQRAVVRLAEEIRRARG